MVEFEVTHEEQMVRLSLARLDRTRGPVVMDVGPVLHLDDVLGSKVAALAGRAQVRDYIDVAAALGRFTGAELRTLALRLDPGLTDRDFADAGSRLDRLPDAVFARYDLDSARSPSCGRGSRTGRERPVGDRHLRDWAAWRSSPPH